MDLAPVWWQKTPENENDDQQRAVALIDETASVEQRQCTWHELNLWNATLYTNRELIGFRWGDIDASRELWPTNLRTENVIEEIGEAFLSKASSSPLKPTPVPHGASWKLERAVRLLDKFIYGVWRQTQAEDACVQAFLDAYTCGLGCVRVAFDDADKAVHVESVFFDNVIIDNRECANRAAPRTYRIRQVQPKASIEAHYGVSLDSQKQYVDYRNVGDGWAVLVEAWRLPDRKGKGGRHVVACCGKLLVDEPWTETWVPLLFFHWQDRTSGFFCKSGIEQLVPYQVRQNELNDTIELSQDLVCRPRLLLNANSMIDVQQWDNEVGRFLMYAGQEPKPFEWRTQLSDLYQERERNKAAAFSHAGISEMFTNADLPRQVRLDSSAGVREARNMEDARHLRRWTRFEAFRLAVARTVLLVLGKSKGAAAFTTVYHPGGSKATAREIPYEAVKMLTEDQFSWTLDAVPLSMMAPAARRETIRDWTSRQLIDENEARRMEGAPDLEREEDLEMSSVEDIYRHLDIVEDGGFEEPTQFTNLTYGIKRFVQNMHRLKRFEDVDKRVIDAHVRWIVKAISIQQAAVQMQQNQAMAFSPTQGVAGTNAALGQPAPPAQAAAAQ